MSRADRIAVAALIAVHLALIAAVLFEQRDQPMSAAPSSLVPIRFWFCTSVTSPTESHGL